MITNRSLAVTLLTLSAAWIFYIKSRSAPGKLVPVATAAEQLRAAWANNHTVA